MELYARARGVLARWSQKNESLEKMKKKTLKSLNGLDGVKKHEIFRFPSWYFCVSHNVRLRVAWTWKKCSQNQHPNLDLTKTRRAKNDYL
jgi:hypothetical protein